MPATYNISITHVARDNTARYIIIITIVIIVIINIIIVSVD